MASGRRRGGALPGAGRCQTTTGSRDGRSSPVAPRHTSASWMRGERLPASPRIPFFSPRNRSAGPIRTEAGPEGAWAWRARPPRTNQGGDRGGLYRGRARGKGRGSAPRPRAVFWGRGHGARAAVPDDGPGTPGRGRFPRENRPSRPGFPGPPVVLRVMR
jgi:hypothetical protein